MANKSKKSLRRGGKVVFNGNIGMETQTRYFENGKIVITPCDFELGQNILAGGKTKVTQRGSVKTLDDGYSAFRPFNTGTGSPFKEIFETAHGSVREYKNVVVVKLTFKKKLGKELIATLYNEESEEVKAFIKTRKTDTQWK